jgi:AbrB family looped-hinge helix DNA binding protein
LGVVFVTLEDETGCGNTLIAAADCSNSAILQCMKANVTITSRGVITLPAKLRKALGLKAEDNLIAETTPEGLLLRPAVTLPVEMYTPARVREFDLAEQELAAYLEAKPAATKRAARPRRKAARQA